MTQLEYSMIGSSCFLSFTEVDKWSECDLKQTLMPYWEKVSDEAKEMASWVDSIETIVHYNTDEDKTGQISNELVNNTLIKAIREQIGDDEYAKKISQYGKEPMFFSFFEDDIDIDLKAIKKQDECGIDYDVDYVKIKEFFLEKFSFLEECLEKEKKEEEEREAVKVLQKVEKDMQSLLFFRGTKEQIIEKLNTIRINREESVVLEPFEEPLEDNDLGFNTNLGEINEHYIDYEIYMLPTNKKDTFVITEVSAF
jgi:hypothetical protein